MKVKRTKGFPFLKGAVKLYDVDGIPYVSVYAICQCIGINSGPEHSKVQRLSETKREALLIDGLACIPISLVNAWLVTINKDKVKDGYAGRLEAGLATCQQVLETYWESMNEQSVQ